jgi:hypothetical protein
LKSPRWRDRSAKNPTTIVIAAATAYGGTVKSCACVLSPILANCLDDLLLWMFEGIRVRCTYAVYPMFLIMVGRNREKAYRGMSAPM